MADVLVTHSYHLPYDAKQLRKMQPYVPLATLYVASALREAGISVAAFDSMLQNPEEHFERSLSEHRPRIVAVYEDDFNFLSKMCLTRMRQVAFNIANVAHAAGAITIVHGSDSTDNPQLFLESGFDFVCCGESEESLVELSRQLLSGDLPLEIDGLARLDSRGRMIRSRQKLARNPNWTRLPFPARELIDLAPYRKAWIEAHGYFSTNMVSSRGCPYQCNWCAKPISGSKFHLRDAASVAQEMKQLKVNCGVEHVWFGDDIFGLDGEWVKEFADEVQVRNAGIPFKIQSRANLMTEKTVEHLAAAGCNEVWMGVESGSQAVLDAMDKGLRLDSVRVARSRLKTAGIRACFFLQFGYPGESWNELQETIAFVRETRPDDVGISFSYPLPGTVFYERVVQQLGAKRNWTDSDDLCIMYHGAYTTDFYRAVRDALHTEVDSWGKPAIGVESLNQIESLWRNVFEMEPNSRNTIAPESLKPQPSFASGTIVPIEKLIAARGM